MFFSILSTKLLRVSGTGRNVAFGGPVWGPATSHEVSVSARSRINGSADLEAVT